MGRKDARLQKGNALEDFIISNSVKLKLTKLYIHGVLVIWRQCCEDIMTMIPLEGSRNKLVK